MCSSGARSTTDAGNSGAPSSAWQSNWCQQGEVIRVIFDDTTKKKAGTHIEGLARYRNGAGSARQEYRTLRGLNFVLGVMRIPLTRWPGHSLSVPVGLELYLKPAQAQQLNMPYRSRSQLARDILDFVAQQVPGRPIRSLADGGYATKDYVRRLPKATHVVGRLPISAKLYTLPPTPPHKRRGAPRKKGDLIGSPKTLAQTATGWSPHPSEAGAEIQAWDGLWHAVLPGRLVRVVVLRREGTPAPKQPGQRKPPPAIEAFFTTDLTLSAHDILHEYDDRWAVEIAIRDTNAFDGLGRDQCRKRQHIIGANTFRLVMAAARTLWFIAQVESWHDVQSVPLLGPGTDRKWPPANSMWRGPVGRPSMRPEFFPYHGSPQIWPKIMRSLSMLYLLQRRARN